MAWVAGIALALLALPGLAVGQRARPELEVAALREAGRYGEAIAVARRANLAPALGTLLRMTGQWDEADRVLREAAASGRTDSLLVALELALLRVERGDVATAYREFDRFIDVYNAGRARTSDELTAVAIAVQYLSVRDPDLARDALRAYDEAITTDPANLEPRLRVGTLFLERYNGTEARASFEAILARDSANPRALLGLARTAQFEGSRRPMELVRRSLAGNPNLVDARVFLAELLAEVGDYAEARRELARALAVNPRSLPALSAQAAVGWLAGDSTAYATGRREVLALNPRYAPFYTTLAELAARQRLYEQAARFARQAIELDSLGWRGHALLGINELRLGRMDRGRAALERAFAGDPYDVWTKNTLDLLDVLDRYPSRRSARFRFVADAADLGVLEPYVSALAEEAWDSLAARYGSAPTPPIRVELFRRHADFSVRTVGLVGLGALGVSFGPVIAMDAPSARPRGEFNWGSTLWHELAHSFHMAVSRYRVPRWFTEGLAVYEERQARRGWGDDVSPGFLSAYRQGRLLPVSRLNDGFVRPAYPAQLGFSYYQASLVCELIVAEHGVDALVAILRAFGEGRETQAVFRDVLGTDLEAFDARFRAWLEARFATQLSALGAHGDGQTAAPTRMATAERARRNPGDFLAQLAMGQQLVRDEQPAAAVPYLERAKALFPEYAEEDGPYRLLARIARQRGDLPRAAAELSAMTAINERAYDARLELADVSLTLGDSIGALEALDGAMYIDPMDLTAHERLARLAEGRGVKSLALRERRAIVALDPSDPADAYYRLARAELQVGDREAARRAVLRALELAPGFDAALELLLELRGGRE